MLDVDKIKFDKDGNLTGLDDQMETLKKEDSFLFKQATPEPDNTQGSDVILDGAHKGNAQDNAPRTLAEAIAEHYNK